MQKLTDKDIEWVLDFIVPNPCIPKDTAVFLVENQKKLLRKQLESIKIYPKLLPTLKKEIRKNFFASQIQPGESVGCVTAQSIGEEQTQKTLNTFHKAGSADRQPVVSKFEELLNATSNPKAPSYLVRFKSHNNTVQELREAVGPTITQLTLKKLAKSIEVCPEKAEEPWYDVFYELYEEKPEKFRDCLSVKVNMDLMYEYKFTLENLAENLEKEYGDIFCIFSPDCFGQIDIYLDTETISIEDIQSRFGEGEDAEEDKRRVGFITEENITEIYLEEVARPILEKTVVTGIPGIMNMFFMQDSDKKWMLDTENSNYREKSQELSFKKNGKDKPLDSVRRFKKILSHPIVDMSRTISNNLWDIYTVLGIEAVRQYMIDEFCKIMSGINACHVQLLVDKMTYPGTINSVSRYSMRSEGSGPMSRASFEETLEHFLNAGLNGEEEHTKNVSTAIISGKRAQMGTGYCNLMVDFSKLL